MRSARSPHASSRDLTPPVISTTPVSYSPVGRTTRGTPSPSYPQAVHPSIDPIHQRHSRSLAMNPTSPQPSTMLNTSETDRKMEDQLMKLSIPHDAFLGALQVVGRAVSTRATLPS